MSLFGAIKNHKRSIVTDMFFGVLFIMIIESLIGSISTLTDNLCVAVFMNDQAAVAAQSIVNTPLLFYYIFAAGLSVGCEIVVSRKMGAGETENANKIVSLVCIVGSVIGIIFFFVLFFAGYQLADLTNGSSDPATLNYAGDYFRGISIGLPFLMVQNILLPIIYLDGDRIRANISIGSMLVINVVGDIIATKVIGGGLFGIGIATSLCYIVGCLVLVLHLFTKKGTFFFTIKGIKFGFLKDVFFNGLPVGVKYVAIFGRSLILGFMIPIVARMFVAPSATVVSAENSAFSIFNIIQSSETFFDAFTGGILSAALMMSSVFYGEDDSKALDFLLKIIVIFNFTVNVVIGIIYIGLAEPLVAIYKNSVDNPATVAEAVTAVRLNGITIPMSAFSASLLAFFQGTKKYTMSYITTIAISFILPTSFMCIGFAMGTMGLWIGRVIGFCSFPILFYVVMSIINKKIPTTARETFLLPKEFGYDKMNEINFRIENISDAMALTNKVREYCRNNNVDEIRTNHLVVIVEELGTMIITSGFVKSKRRRACEMRILFKDNNLVVRTRDNCERFDIKERMKHLDEYIDGRNISAKVIDSLAKNVEYANILRTNNMIISL